MFFHRNSRAEGPTILVRIKYDSHEPAFLTTLNERLANFPHHRNVENIQRWTRKGNTPDPIVNVEFDVFVVVGH